jgi:hypothetical protein
MPMLRQWTYTYERAFCILPVFFDLFFGGCELDKGEQD